MIEESGQNSVDFFSKFNGLIQRNVFSIACKEVS